MARLPRLDFAGIAQHVVQRGNDRQPWFAEALDPVEAANQRAHTQQQRVWGSAGCVPRSTPSSRAPPPSARAGAQDHPKSDPDPLVAELIIVGTARLGRSDH